MTMPKNKKPAYMPRPGGPRPKKRSIKKQTGETNTTPARLCLNCGQELHGEYCSHCGQEHVESGVPGGEMFREFLKDEFHFDFRIVRTIIPLLFRPGFLTSEYVAGRRVRYSPPLRTYVFISVIMFALIALSARKNYFEAEGKHQPGDKEAKAPFSITVTPHGDTTGPGLADSLLSVHGLKDSLMAEISEAQGDTAGEQSSFEKSVERGVEKLLEDKEKFFEQLLERAAQAMFLLMPIFALLLKLLYLRRKRQYMEHLVFALNVHSHAFLMFLIVAAGNLAGWAWLAPWLKWPLIATPLYLFLAMKKFYRQSWGKTLAKYLLLLGGYGFILLAAGVAVLVASVIWF